MIKKGKFAKEAEIIQTFLAIFGLLQILFFIKGQFTPFGFFPADIWWQDTVAALIVATIFIISHLVIASGWLDGRISLKVRIILCGIPCALGGALITYCFGLQYYLDFILPDRMEASAKNVAWYLSFLVSVFVYMGIFLVREWNYVKQTESYNAAVDKYKKESTT